MKTQMTLTINDQQHTLPVIPGEMLSSLLRERLHLTGTKIGCGEGVCGSCTVLMDGRPILSCIFPADRADGKTIVTIEGLARRVNQELHLHPLQKAFIEYGAVQCGFCTPGQIMTAYALLQRNPDPSRSEIRRALKSRLCRCAAYPSIEKAILAAARSLITDDPLQLPHIPDSIRAGSVIGHPQTRPDALGKVTGGAIFSDDLTFEDMLHAKVRRALVPHAILKKLNVSQAIALKGVISVLTAHDIPGERHHGLVTDDWPVMVAVGERIRYAGDALAIIAAETSQIADQACALIEAEFDLLPVISNPVQARQEGQPTLHANGNLLQHIKVRKGNVAEGFAGSDVVLEHTFHTQISDHAFLEPECSIAVPTPDGRMEIYVGSQIPYEDRRQVARVLGWDEDRVRIVGQLMGGGFGGKEDISGQIHAALLADAVQRPVKLLFDRRESFLVHPKRHATQIHVKVGAKADGRLVAVQTELYGDTGAYASLGDKVMTRATTHSAGPYDIPHVQADCYAMHTNNPPAGAFRGFGVTQSTFAIESIMDMLAGKLNIDPLELRKMNALHLGSITNTGQKIDESIGLTECLQKVSAELHKFTPHPFKPVVDKTQPNLVRAWGLAAAYKNTGLGGEAVDASSAEIELMDDGTFEVRCSAAELGQGLVSVMQMIVCEEMGLPMNKVRVRVMDTDRTPDGGPTTASRQTYVTGNASRYAALSLRDAISALLAEKFDLDPIEICFQNGSVCFGDRTLDYTDVAREMKASGRSTRMLYKYTAPKTQKLGTGGDMHFAYSYGVQAAQVEVNTLNGEVKVLNVIAANDVGTALNPLGLQGQVEGGVVMGLGNCLTEKFIVESGHVKTQKLSQYQVPGIMRTPEITSIIVEHPTTDGPYGAKGVGEISSIPTTPAITNAIYNAVGVRIDTTPVDPKRLIIS
jgi:selenium-dependent xanthine dehydrogenase